MSLPGRLASPGLLSSSHSPGLGDESPAMPGTVNCCQLGRIQPYSSPESGVSWSDPGLHSFQGFSLPAESREAMLNRRRIPVWRQAARFFAEKAVRNSVFPDGDHSTRYSYECDHFSFVLIFCGSGDSSMIQLNPECRMDLEWWIEVDCLQSGISLVQVNPHLNFWSDSSDMGWGTHLQDVSASDLWSQEEALLSINARELLAVEFGLHKFQHLVSNSSVAVFADNSTALAYLRKQGGTRSPLLYIGRSGDSQVWIHGWCRCWGGVIFALHFGFSTFYGIHPLPH